MAWGVSATRSYYAAQWALGRVGGGFILAYHDLDAPRFVEQIELSVRTGRFHSPS